MARDFLIQQERLVAAQSICQGMAQLSGAATQIISVTQQLASMRNTIVAGVGANYDQEDVDRLDSITARVVAIRTAAEAFLA